MFEGYRVLELGTWVMVPAAAMVLADFGADVIKVEHPRDRRPGRGMVGAGPKAGEVSLFVELTNRGKRSVGIDVSTDAGREVLYKLASTCDVFMTSFLPDARRKHHIDVDDIRAHNPDIVYVRADAVGLLGPESGKPGYDFSVFWGGRASERRLGPARRRTDVAPARVRRQDVGDEHRLRRGRGPPAARAHRADRRSSMSRCSARRSGRTPATSPTRRPWAATSRPGSAAEHQPDRDVPNQRRALDQLTMLDVRPVVAGPVPPDGSGDLLADERFSPTPPPSRERRGVGPRDRRHVRRRTLPSGGGSCRRAAGPVRVRAEAARGRSTTRRCSPTATSPRCATRPGSC